MRVKDENNFIQENDENDEEPDINSNYVEIPGKEGKFKPKPCPGALGL